MAAGKTLHLYMTILALSLLVSSIHLTTSRAISRAILSPEDTLEMNKAENVMEVVEHDQFFHGRMDLEINRDYPGSGANNKHTPIPQVKN